MVYLITGPTRLSGTVRCSGAKNSALKVLAASLIGDAPSSFSELADDTLDVKAKLGMLEALGCRISREGAVTRIDPARIDPAGLQSYRGPEVRTNLLLLGALLHRRQKIIVSLPGGCDLGRRGFDLHLWALEKLGARCSVTPHSIEAYAPAGLKGATIEFPTVTTGGTENALLAAVMAEGTTRLVNAHTRPEVMDLIAYLRKRGADIEVPVNGIIEVRGPFSPGAVSHEIAPDGSEAFSYLAMAIISGGAVTIERFPAESLVIPLEHLKAAGVPVHFGQGSVSVSSPPFLGPFHVVTNPYPSTNSDLQPFFCGLALRSTGTSRITDLRFPERFAYVSELARMGARIELSGNTITLIGPQRLAAADVTAPDLRAGALLVGAATAIEGRVRVAGAQQVQRGYSRFVEKLSALGASITCADG